MTIIYTSDIEKAFTIAKAIGSGIIMGGKTYRGQEIEIKEAELKSSSVDDGFVRTVYAGSETLVTWGSGIKLCTEDEMQPGWENIEVFCPEEIKFVEKEGLEAEAKKLYTLFTDKDNDTIIDASEGVIGRARFTALVQYTGILTSRKTIKRVNIESYDNEGIIHAFENALSCDMTTRCIARDITHQKIYYIASANLKTIYPDQAKYPNFMDLPLLSEIADRTDKINEEDAKTKYSVFIQATLVKTGEIFTLESKRAEFPKLEDANAFMDKIQRSQTVTVEKNEAYEHCQGPHSIQSLIEEAKRLHHYTEDYTRNVILRLSSSGYIKNASSNKRTIPEAEIDNVRFLIKKLARSTKIVPEYIKNNIDKVEIEKSCINTNDRKCGILITGKPLDNSATDAEKNIYFLIAKEMVKLFAGRKKLLKTKVILNIKDIPFTASGTKLLYPGFSSLDDPIVYKNEIPEDIEDGAEVRIVLQPSQKVGAPPQPLKEADIKRKYTGEKAPVTYSIDQINYALDDLTRKEFIVRKNKTLYASEKGLEAIHYLKNFDGLLAAPVIWENTLSKIVNKEETSTEEAESLCKNISTEAINSIKSWVEQRNEIAGIKTDISCPVCGKNLVSNSKGLSCNGCGFKTERVIMGRRHENSEFKHLFTSGSTRLLSGYLKDTESVYGRLVFTDDKKIAWTQDSQLECPSCGTKLRCDESGYYCPSCSVTIKRSYLGYKLSGAEIIALATKGVTPLLSGLVSQGRTFDGVLYLDRDDCNKVKCIEIRDEE